MSRLKGKWEGVVTIAFDFDKSECSPINEMNRLLHDVLSSSIKETIKGNYEGIVKISDVKVQDFVEV